MADPNSAMPHSAMPLSAKIAARQLNTTTLAAPCRLALTLGLSILTVCGCGPTKPEANEKPAAVRTDVPLRVVVVSDEDYQGELKLPWSRISEQPLDVQTVSPADLKAAADAADVLLLPERMIGEAAGSGLITSLPDKLAKEIVRELQVPRRLVEEQTRWRGECIGYSLGSPVPVIAAGANPTIAAKPIESWATWRQVAADLQAQAKQQVAAEPLAGGWAAIMFLTRVSAVDTERWLFDGESMQPSLTQPEYVQVLEEMKQARAHYPAELLTPGQIYEQLQSGKLQLGIIAPRKAPEQPLMIAPIPSARWPLTGQGLVACMSRGCRQSSSARSFLRWLAGPESVTGAARQDAGLLLNSTLEEAPGIGWPDYDKQVASQLNSPMGNEAFLRIRGADRYLKALDSAVLKALSGEVTPTAALGAAATEWSAITKELGLESQQAQWRHSIGLL